VSDLHALLLRQLKRAGVTAETPPTAQQWSELCTTVSRTYRAADEDRYTIERSLELTSAEMNTLYKRLSEENLRLERELDIARVLQTSLLPKAPQVPSFDVAGRMIPATEVGGDYYDVVPVDGACWVGIGDVAGHGLRAAISMLMAQSMIAALVRAFPSAKPSELLRLANAGLWEGTRKRMGIDDHMTCTLMRATTDGAIEYAGAHETVLVSRRGAPCERIESSGTWLSVVPDLADLNPDARIQLSPGDLVVLHTDGVIEEQNSAKEEFGLDRLAALVDARRDAPLGDLCDEVLGAVSAWTRQQRDDLTVVAVRYLGT
jgi:serine phosphatase RsbU (regulator of sigma subunit)